MTKKFVITKTDALKLFGRPIDLAKALDVSRSNISQWKDDEPIPEKHALRIRYELKPEHF